jgi:hypothetical protein
MVVNCGGGTVDLTTCKLVGNNPLQLDEITERIGDFCGGTFIDREFVQFLCRKLEYHAIDLLMENHYDQFQYMVQEFCRCVKEPFTGDDRRFHYELDINENAPTLSQYISEKITENMKESEWVIDIKYDDIKSMFDPVVNRIIHLIHTQLSNIYEKVSAVFLVGGFSENKYLQKRIKHKFQHIIGIISVLNQPITAIARGSCNLWIIYKIK